MTDQARAAEARRVAVDAMLAAIDGRDQDLHDLLADADPAELQVAAGGLALTVGAMAAAMPPDRRAAFREHLASQALEMVGWTQN